MDPSNLAGAAEHLEAEIRRGEARARGIANQLQTVHADLEEMRGALVTIRKLIARGVGVAPTQVRFLIPEDVPARSPRLELPKQGPAPSEASLLTSESPPRKPQRGETVALVEREIGADPGVPSAELATRLAPHLKTATNARKLVFSTISYLIKEGRVRREDGRLFPSQTTSAPDAVTSEADANGTGEGVA